MRKLKHQAGRMVVSLATRDADIRVQHEKLEALAFGFLIPIFFIVNGMKLDAAAIFGSGEGVVALGEIGVANRLIRSAEAAPLVAGAMLYPVMALRLTAQSVDRATAHLNDKDGF